MECSQCLTSDGSEVGTFLPSGVRHWEWSSQSGTPVLSILRNSSFSACGVLTFCDEII